MDTLDYSIAGRFGRYSSFNRFVLFFSVVVVNLFLIAQKSSSPCSGVRATFLVSSLLVSNEGALLSNMGSRESSLCEPNKLLPIVPLEVEEGTLIYDVYFHLEYTTMLTYCSPTDPEPVPSAYRNENSLSGYHLVLEIRDTA